MSESRPEKRKVEFIESYWTGGELGANYQWNDNHGELIRCKDCKWFEVHPANQFFGWEESFYCNNPRLTDQEGISTKGCNWFCADGVK